jgi:hypothetical protein
MVGRAASRVPYRTANNSKTTGTEFSGRKMEILTAQKEISSWCNTVFPDRTKAGVLVKFFEEIGELTKCPKEAHEYADVFILLADLAELNGINLEEAIVEKMAINKSRQWKLDKELGIMNHV